MVPNLSGSRDIFQKKNCLPSTGRLGDGFTCNLDPAYVEMKLCSLARCLHGSVPNRPQTGSGLQVGGRGLDLYLDDAVEKNMSLITKVLSRERVTLNLLHFSFLQYEFCSMKDQI